MTSNRETPSGPMAALALADDADAVEQAHELVLRLDLIRQLAGHPATNRTQIEMHRAECNDLIRAIGAHLLTAVYA